MPTEIKMWNIDDNVPRAIPSEKLDLESKLEEWIQTDPALVSSEIIIIGKQVKTEHGGFIDLLALDQDGNLVILELKRDKTPRDIVAQILDYGSWVEQLDSQQIQEIAEDYLGNQSLEAAFSEKFQVEALPEVLNERHRMFIVASQLDAASERIVKYLSESYNVDINVVTFSFFKTPSGEMLCRSFLLDELQVAGRAKRRSKRQPPKTWEEIEKLAIEKNVLPLYKKALSELGTFFDSATPTLSGVMKRGTPLNNSIDEERAGMIIKGLCQEQPILNLQEFCTTSSAASEVETFSSLTDLARQLGLSSPGVGYVVQRG